ncbi:MAG: aminotransferase class I/II-fold pyridoxal phosphate-dependent enzyme [Planctomycetota bacterium]|nr:MAG: aminotransferase class I/II-fold pyridoxal phosphate-dependent enzyme [Planctomycetota bacterium]
MPGSFFGPSNLVELVQHRASHQPRDRAFIYLLDGETDEVELTYRELDRQARAVAARLQEMNLAGERALLLYPAGLDFIAAFFGCLYAGVVAVPAYPPRRNRSLTRIQSIADDADARVALTTFAVWERVQPVLDQTPDLTKIEWLCTDQLPEKIENQWQSPDVHGDTLAFLQYTSGSTGVPKGVMLTHANLMHNSASIAYAFEHTRSGGGVFWLPSYHDMGLIGGILQPLYIGRPNVLMSPMAFLQKPLRWLKAISRYRATISGGPNFAYDLCVKKVTPEQRATLDLSSWNLAFNGAEPVRAETIDAFSRMFEPAGFRRTAFYPCYGMAEATLIVTGGFKAALPVVRTFDSEALENNHVVDALSDEDGARELVGSGGKLLDQSILIAHPEHMTTQPPDQVGEIWVSGPSVAQGYWKRPEETERTFKAYLKDTGEGPYLRTGDLGFIQDGELFVTGRLKDLIIIRGLNHYPQDIEATADRSHARVRQGNGAAFVAEVDGVDRLVLVQEIERGPLEELDGVIEAIRRAVSAEHELNLDGVALMKAGTIPKTSSGKIQRHACRQAFIDGSLPSVALWRSWSAAPAAQPAAQSPASDKAAAGLARGARRDPAHASPARDANGKSTRTQAEMTTVEIVLEHVRAVAKERAVGLSIDSSIVELGLDSLERMEIVAALEETYGGRFPEDVLPQIETVREVAAAVETYLGKTPRAREERAASEEIPEEAYRFECFPEYKRLKQQMEASYSAGYRNPFFTVHERVINDTTLIDGREMVSFSSYNYIGTSGEPRVVAAVKRAIERYGTSVSASRLVSGEKPIHGELEQAIADFIGVDAALAFVGGHSTNETTLGHLLGPGDLILHDALAHNSIVQGAILSGARRRAFPHNDCKALDALLEELRGAYRRVVIAIEGVYSMDGDISDVPRFIDIKRRHKALLYVDEAHSLGILGRRGRGVSEHFGIDPREVDVWMGTLSKSLGSCGGYIAGNHALIEYLKYTAPGFLFAAGMTPSNTAAALAALRVLEAEPQRVARLHDRSELFLKLARERGLNTGMSQGSPIVPVILGNSLDTLRLAQALFDRGINVQPILHPAVEEEAARLRFFITSEHSDQQIRDTVEAVAEELARIDTRYLKQPAATTNGVHAGSASPARAR